MNPFQTSPQTLIANAIANETNILLMAKKNGISRIFNFVYYGKPIISATDKPLSLEAVQAQFDTFGSNGALLFEGAGLEIQGIMFADPSYVPQTPPYPYVINADGTVTFSAQP